MPTTTSHHRAVTRGSAEEHKLPQPYLTVPEVAAMLAVSEDTIIRQFEDREGVIDIGTPGRIHKRRKRALRIPQSTLERFIYERQVRTVRRG